MADAEGLRANVADAGAIEAYEFLCFSDSSLDHGLVRKPTREDARRILNFYHQAKAMEKVAYFVAQCEAGVGRSQAVVAALHRVEGRDNRDILRAGTYNRALYRLLLEEAGIEPEPEPLVSIVIRLKYTLNHLQSFLNCMDRQRYSRWEVVAVTDGPLLYASPCHPKVRLISTSEAKGRWGHPYRQVGIDAAEGEWIGLSNDDNYYVPGYIEQMTFAGMEHEADLVFCQLLHSHAGWRLVRPGVDLGGFLARRELVRRVEWRGDKFDSDRRYIESLQRLSRNTVVVERPLFIHN
jgi:hypothetical protein